MFKVGQKVVFKGADGFGDCVVGKEYVVDAFFEPNYGGENDTVKVGTYTYYAHRFDPVVDIANGVDAHGKAIFFDLANLKSWMRVITINDFRYIVAEKAGVTVLVRDGAWNGEPCMTGSFAIEAVYAAPDAEDYLNLQVHGELVWKRTPQKTSEQIAQEAALAARNKAIEEAEKALKIAQKALDDLKGM